MTLPLRQPAGLSGLHLPQPRRALVHRDLPRSSSAIAGAPPDHGCSNGVRAMNNSVPQRILSLWLRRLSTDRIARSRKTFAPLAVSGRRGNAEILTAIDDAAERHGLSCGLTLAQARAMHPGIEVIAEDAEADDALLESIADWCLR